MIAPTERIEFTWSLIPSDDHLTTWLCEIQGGPHIGWVQVMPDGRFKAKHRGKWVSSKPVTAPIQPFDTLVQATQAVMRKELETRAAEALTP